MTRSANTAARAHAKSKRRAAPARSKRAMPTRRTSNPPEPPRDLEQSLRDDRAAREAFDAMPPSHRRAYIEFVEEAARPETRVRRIQQALRMMAEWGAERAGAKRKA